MTDHLLLIRKLRSMDGKADILIAGPKSRQLSFSASVMVVWTEHETLWAFRRRQACGQSSALPELDDSPLLAKREGFARHLSPLSAG